MLGSNGSILLKSSSRALNHLSLNLRYSTSDIREPHFNPPKGIPTISQSAGSIENRGKLKGNVFDRSAKRFQRKSAALSKDFAVYQYVKEEFGYRMSDRVWDIKRKFTNAVELSSGGGFVSQHLTKVICM